MVACHGLAAAVPSMGCRKRIARAKLQNRGLPTDKEGTCRSLGRSAAALPLPPAGLLSAVGDGRGSTTTSAVTASAAFDSVAGSGGGAGNYGLQPVSIRQRSMTT